MHATSVGCVAPGVRYMRVREATKLYRGMKAHHGVMLIYSGRSESWADGRTGVNGPGDLQLKEPGQVHRDLWRDSPGSLQLLSFDSELIDSARAALGIPTSARLRTTHLHRNDPRAASFRALHRIAEGRHDAFAVEEAIAEATAAFASHFENAGDEARADIRLRVNVKRARDFLLTHLAEPVTLDVVAEHAKTDKFHLCRAFTAQIGLSPYRFLTHARIARACQLLARGTRPSDLAHGLGFSDQSQMHRHFVRLIGLTPGHYARGR